MPRVALLLALASALAAAYSPPPVLVPRASAPRAWAHGALCPQVAPPGLSLSASLRAPPERCDERERGARARVHDHERPPARTHAVTRHVPVCLAVPRRGLLCALDARASLGSNPGPAGDAGTQGLALGPAQGSRGPARLSIACAGARAPCSAAAHPSPLSAPQMLPRSRPRPGAQARRARQEWVAQLQFYQGKDLKINWKRPIASGNFGSVFYGSTPDGRQCVVKCPVLDEFALRLFDTERCVRAPRCSLAPAPACARTCMLTCTRARKHACLFCSQTCQMRLDVGMGTCRDAFPCPHADAFEADAFEADAFEMSAQTYIQFRQCMQSKRAPHLIPHLETRNLKPETLQGGQHQAQPKNGTAVCALGHNVRRSQCASQP